jgi:hypothetical protein
MPNFERFCGNLFDQGNRVSLYTSLMINREHKSFRFLLESGRSGIEYIMASYHPEAEHQEDDFWQRVKSLSEAGHSVFLRFVGHPKRLNALSRLADRCRELDICFYPTTLFSDNYPHSYTDGERLELAKHFSSLSQVIQMAGGIDTTRSKCFAGSRIVAVHLPSGDIWPCISVHKPVLGNVYDDCLTLLEGAISCPEAGIACICDIHFQQNIVLGTEDNDRFEAQKQGYVEPMPLPEQIEEVKKRCLRFTKAPKGIGHVLDDMALVYSKSYVKQQFQKNFSTGQSAAEISRSDYFVAAQTAPAVDSASDSTASIVSIEARKPDEGQSPAGNSAERTCLKETSEIRSLEAQFLTPEQDLLLLRQTVQQQQREMARLKLEVERWDNFWRSVETSAGWRLLSAWRNARDRLAPQATCRRRIYEKVTTFLRQHL